MSSKTVTYRAVVSAILTDSEGRILLQQRDDNPEILYAGWWTLFGGYVEEGEAVEDAIKRELREELDLTLPLTAWNAYTCPVRSKVGEIVTINHIFIGEVDRPIESLTLKEGASMALFEPESAAALNLAFAQHMIVRDYVQEKHNIPHELKYLLYPPTKLEENTAYPLIIFLHGMGERGDDLELVKIHGITQYLEQGGELPAYVVAPQCPTDLDWRYLGDHLDALYERILREYAIDADRVYLTGFSMGSYGTWQWASEQPNRFAALMPVAGNGYSARTGEYKLDLSQLSHLPIWMIHSVADAAVSIKGADDFYRDLMRHTKKFGYTRYPDANHVETAKIAYSDQALYQWLFRQKRGGGV